VYIGDSVKGDNDGLNVGSIVCLAGVPLVGDVATGDTVGLVMGT
jgi:hypothetical protein